jgi:hypothetical protein
VSAMSRSKVGAVARRPRSAVCSKISCIEAVCVRGTCPEEDAP